MLDLTQLCAQGSGEALGEIVMEGQGLLHAAGQNSIMAARSWLGLKSPKGSIFMSMSNFL